MTNYQPAILRFSMPELSLENIEILQIKCSDFDPGVFVNNKVVQATISQKDKEIESIKAQLDSLESVKNQTKTKKGE